MNKKRNLWLKIFVFLLIFILLFSAIGVVVIYLTNTPPQEQKQQNIDKIKQDDAIKLPQIKKWKDIIKIEQNNKEIKDIIENKEKEKKEINTMNNNKKVDNILNNIDDVLEKNSSL